ncbi:MAG TPA: hypothetical protein VI911_09625 [Patescibacteria group bacterium]|nr:hypothetical protein [Patescibacteria group bacterium]
MIREDMTKKEIEERINLFLRYNTYTFIRVLVNNEFFYYNGFIIKNEKDSVLFNDEKIKEIPLSKDKIRFIDKSTRGEK